MANVMKTGIFTSLLILVITACEKQENQNAQQASVEVAFDNVIVEAKKKIYHDDGTRSYKDYEPFQTRVIEKTPNNPPSLTKYGGLKSLRFDSTGFYHVQKAGNRWWAVDPSGHAFIHMAINSINTGDSERNKQALQEKFGDEKGWIRETAHMLHDYGFNGAGSWSDAEAVRYANQQNEKPLAYTINLNFMSSYGDERGGTWQVPGHKAYPNDAIFVFDPEFELFCDRHAQQIIKYKDDPNLFGYFSDNEMPFKRNMLIGYLTLENKEDPGYLAAKAWLDQKGITESDINDAVKDDFRAYAADRYFTIVSNAIKKHDPNHMYLGARFYSSEKHNKAFMEVAGKYMDIISNNYYGRWTPVKEEMDEWAAWTGKPFIITEYYTKGEDSGMPNQSGAGWIVKTQQDRGLFYQNFNLALLESGDCVGWHYFKYQDNDPTLEGAEPSNIDSNKGIVNNYYEPWQPMLDEMKELNAHVYQVIEYFDKNEK